MSEESLSTMSAAGTTGTDDVQTTDGHTRTSSSSREAGFYFQSAIVVVGIIGAVANALVLYAMIVSKEHKKHLLIFNQNAFDFCSSVLLVVVYTSRLGKIQLSGMLGYWLCMMVLSGTLLWASIIGSNINLMSVTIERYIKVVHSGWSRKLLRKWVICSAAAFAWIAGIVYELTLGITTSAVIDGVCHGYDIWKSKTAALIHGVWNFGSLYMLAIVVVVFCYGSILIVIRRQARVVAAHSGTGSSTSQQTPSSHVQSSVIKTMLLVSAFFAIAWMPNYVFFSASARHGRPFVITWRILLQHVLGISLYHCQPVHLRRQVRFSQTRPGASDSVEEIAASGPRRPCAPTDRVNFAPPLKI